MTPGSIFFDKKFDFHDGASGEKLFVVLAYAPGTSVVCKTTSKRHGRGSAYGCQPQDRFPNFHLPSGCCELRTDTWVCLDEFYELSTNKMLQKRFAGDVEHICTLSDAITRGIQDCALISQDISRAQMAAVSSSLVSL